MGRPLCVKIPLKRKPLCFDTIYTRFDQQRGLGSTSSSQWRWSCSDPHWEGSSSSPFLPRTLLRAWGSGSSDLWAVWQKDLRDDLVGFLKLIFYLCSSLYFSRSPCCNRKRTAFLAHFQVQPWTWHLAGPCTKPPLLQLRGKHLLFM